MLPDYTISSIAVSSDLIGGRGKGVSNLIDYETGPIQIQDTSEGLNYQEWYGQVCLDGIYIGSATQLPIKYIDLPDITSFSFTFIQNGDLTICYIRHNITYLWWYDSLVEDKVTTDFGSNLKTPKVSLDDKRTKSSSINDVIFAYIKTEGLYYRLQRDRYATEYFVALNPDIENFEWHLDKIGMNTKLRFQFNIKSILRGQI